MLLGPYARVLRFIYRSKVQCVWISLGPAWALLWCPHAFSCGPFLLAALNLILCFRFATCQHPGLPRSLSSVFLKQVLSLNLKLSRSAGGWPASGLSVSTSPGLGSSCMPGVQLLLVFSMGSGNQIQILTACKASSLPSPQSFSF